MNVKDEEQVVDIRMCEKCPNKPPHAFFYTNKGRRATNPVTSKEDAIETINSNPGLFRENKQQLIEKINKSSLIEHEEGGFDRAIGTLIKESLLLYALHEILNPNPHSTTPDQPRTETNKLTVRQCEAPTFLVPPHGYIFTEAGEKYRPGQFFSAQGGRLLINRLFKIRVISEQEKETLISQLKNLNLPEKGKKAELDRIKELVKQKNKEMIQKDLRKTPEQNIVSTMTIRYFIARS